MGYVHGVDPRGALADLSEISSQIEAAVVFSPDGAVLGSTAGEERSQRLARTALDLLAAGGEAGTPDGRRLTQIEATLRDGSLFVVSGEERGIVATTTPEPTSGLVFYDLRTCLRSLEADAAEAKPVQPRRRKKKDDDA